MKRIMIEVSDDEYRKILFGCNRRNTSPESLCKRMLLQIGNNESINAAKHKQHKKHK